MQLLFNYSTVVFVEFYTLNSIFAQEFSERDLHSPMVAFQNILESLPSEAIVFFSDETHFHISGCVNK